MENAMRRFILWTILAATFTASPALAIDPPKRKSGLWEINMTTSYAKEPRAMQMCVDEKTDNVMAQQAQGMGKQMCTKNDIRKEGDRIVVDSICKFGNGTATTHAVITGKFDSAYHIDAKTTYDPPMNGMKDGSTAIDAKWAGPCKPGQKPGDVVMPGQGVVNMNDIMKSIPKH